MSNKIQFKKLTATSITPTLSSKDSAGFDIYAPERRDIPPKSSYLVGSGMAVSIPKGYVGLILPRYSVSSKHDVVVGSSLINSNFKGEIKIHLQNNGKDTFEIKAKDQLAQLVVVPCFLDHEEVEDFL